VVGRLENSVFCRSVARRVHTTRRGRSGVASKREVSRMIFGPPREPGSWATVQASATSVLGVPTRPVSNAPRGPALSGDEVGRGPAPNFLNSNSSLVGSCEYTQRRTGSPSRPLRSACSGFEAPSRTRVFDAWRTTDPGAPPRDQEPPWPISLLDESPGRATHSKGPDRGRSQADPSERPVGAGPIPGRGRRWRRRFSNALQRVKSRRGSTRPRRPPT